MTSRALPTGAPPRQRRPAGLNWDRPAMALAQGCVGNCLGSCAVAHGAMAKLRCGLHPAIATTRAYRRTTMAFASPGRFRRPRPASAHKGSARISPPATLRALRARAPDTARPWSVVGEGVTSCPRAWCGKSARHVRCGACGNGAAVELLRHRQTKEADNRCAWPTVPRYISTLRSRA